MKIEEEFSKLRPVFGKSIDKLWMNYLIEDSKGKKEIENLLPIFSSQTLNENYEEKLLLVPPTKNQAFGEYFIGNVEYADKEIYPFGLRENEWIQHTCVFGRSGCGKTNLVFGLIKIFLDKKKPFLIFDWKRNYRDLLVGENSKKILVFTIGNNVCPFRFNPLIPPSGIDPEIWLKKLVEIIAHAYFLGEGVIYLLHKTIDAIYTEFGVYSGDVKKYPTMKDVLNRLEKLKLRGRQSLWLASTIRAIYSLSFGEVGKVFCTDKNIPIDYLLKKNVILELDSLINSDKIFFTEALLLWIHHYRLTEDKRETFKHAVILEEAHHILLRRKQEIKGEETITDIILREIRELGESITIVDQHPSLISPTAIGNTFCTIVMNLKHRNDINIIDDTLLLNKNDFLNKLPIGYGIVKLQGRYYDPFLIKIPLFPVKKGTITDYNIKELMKGFFGFFKIDKTEKHGISGFSKLDKISINEREFMEDIAKSPFSKVTERYKRLNLNYREGNNIQNSLIWKGYIKPIKIILKNTWIKLFEFTNKGKDQLSYLGTNINDSMRRGGIEHQYWVNKVAEFYRNKGYDIYIEKPIGNGKSVDLEIRKDVEIIAVEVETGKSDVIGNIQKCLLSGYEKIVILSTNWKVFIDIKEKTKKSGVDKKVNIVSVNGLM